MSSRALSKLPTPTASCRGVAAAAAMAVRASLVNTMVRPSSMPLVVVVVRFPVVVI
jgi:hypothetical protein